MKSLYHKSLCIILMLSSLSVCGNSDNHQFERSIVKYNYYNQNFQDSVIVQEYLLTNNTSETYYTWIDYSYNAENESMEKEIRRYFNKHFGDFNLFQLLFDDVILHDYSPVLGITFLKAIKPGDSFRYITLNTQDDSWTDYVLAVSESDIHIDMKGAPEELFYNRDYIILP